jgi:predicted double-glycine peptidase
MPGKPPFFAQERDYSCVPACLRMVLARNGISKTEDDLIYECGGVGTGSEGSETGFVPDQLVQAARNLGFPHTVKGRPTIEELEAWIDNDIYPIVWICPAVGLHHAVVVVEVQSGMVLVNDPAQPTGEYEILRDQFESAWGLTGRLAVVIRR